MKRSGKSTDSLMIKQKLMKDNISEKQIIFMNLDAIVNEQYLDYHKLYEYITSKLNKGIMNYVFLDKIQTVPSFEKCVNSLFLKENIDIYITDSNSYMLSGELATFLTWRCITIEILPLSFKEFLDIFSSDGNLDVQSKFREYLRYGALPYVTSLEKEQLIIDEYYHGIYYTVLLKDIVRRNKIIDVYLLESIVKFLFDNIGKILCF